MVYITCIVSLIPGQSVVTPSTRIHHRRFRLSYRLTLLHHLELRRQGFNHLPCLIEFGSQCRVFGLHQFLLLLNRLGQHSDLFHCSAVFGSDTICRMVGGEALEEH